MQQPPPDPSQKPITYFIVQPEQFQQVCAKLGSLPYMEVTQLLSDFVGTSRAMFTPLPGRTPPPGPDGKKPGPPSGNGNGSEPPAGLTDSERPGWTRLEAKDPEGDVVQEYDAANDCWWRKDAPDIDSGDPGGAE